MPAYPLTHMSPDMDRTHADLAGMRTEMAQMRTEMARMKADIARMLWLQAIGIVGVLGTLMALFRFL